MTQYSLAPQKVRYSLKLKLSLGLILIIGIFFAGVNIFNILSHRASRRSEALANTETVARLVAGAMLGELSASELKSESMRVVVLNFLNAALTLNKKNKDLAYVVVVDDAGELVVGRAKPELTVFPGGKKYAKEATALAEIAKLEGRLGGNMRYKRFPLKVNNRRVGKVIVGTSLARLETEVRRELSINVGVLIGTLLILILYAGITLNRMVIAPLSSVADAMRAVQSGDLHHELHLERRDEIGLLASTYNIMVQGLREQERLKDAFNRYVSKQVYAKFTAGEITLTGESRNATILFSDIRSFTTLSERLTPQQVVAMLNEYFNEMVAIVFKYDGFLNKFMGDALLAIYNVPLNQDYPELRAVSTALDMVAALKRLNASRKERGLYPLKIGVGINTGPVVAGNIGHEKRLEYTVIGDAVNLAQRIESQTKVVGSSILVSETTYAAVRDFIEAEPLPPVKVKGKQEPVALYSVTGLRQTISDDLRKLGRR